MRTPLSIQDTLPGSQGVHNRGAPLYTLEGFHCMYGGIRGAPLYACMEALEGFHCMSNVSYKILFLCQYGLRAQSAGAAGYQGLGQTGGL